MVSAANRWISVSLVDSKLKEYQIGKRQAVKSVPYAFVAKDLPCAPHDFVIQNNFVVKGKLSANRDVEAKMSGFDGRVTIHDAAKVERALSTTDSAKVTAGSIAVAAETIPSVIKSASESNATKIANASVGNTLFAQTAIVKSLDLTDTQTRLWGNQKDVLASDTVLGSGVTSVTLLDKASSDVLLTATLLLECGSGELTANVESGVISFPVTFDLIFNGKGLVIEESIMIPVSKGNDCSVTLGSVNGGKVSVRNVAFFPFAGTLAD